MHCGLDYLPSFRYLELSAKQWGFLRIVMQCVAVRGKSLFFARSRL
jgi:hypothetical protein